MDKEHASRCGRRGLDPDNVEVPPYPNKEPRKWPHVCALERYPVSDEAADITAPVALPSQMEGYCGDWDE